MDYYPIYILIIMIGLTGPPRLRTVSNSAIGGQVAYDLILPYPALNRHMAVRWRDEAEQKTRRNGDKRIIRRRKYRPIIEFGYTGLDETIFRALIGILAQKEIRIQPRTKLPTDVITTVPDLRVICTSELPTTDKVVFGRRYSIEITLEGTEVYERPEFSMVQMLQIDAGYPIPDWIATGYSWDIEFTDVIQQITPINAPVWLNMALSGNVLTLSGIPTSNADFDIELEVSNGYSTFRIQQADIPVV